MSIETCRGDEVTAVFVAARFVASVSPRWALDWQGHAARFGWIVVDEAAETVVGDYRSRVVAEASAKRLARQYLPS